MIQGIIFDLDGMIVHGERFSNRLEKEYGISLSTTMPFFKGDFQKCIIGGADLKEILPDYFPEWGWKGTLEELLNFWFAEEASQIDQRFEVITRNLKAEGIRCYLATNNEQYRTQSLLSNRQLGSWFDDVFASYILKAKKPEVEFFSKMLSKVSLPQSNLEFWDDDPENIAGAIRANLPAQLYEDFEQFKNRVGSLGQS